MSLYRNKNNRLKFEVVVVCCLYSQIDSEVHKRQRYGGVTVQWANIARKQARVSVCGGCPDEGTGHTLALQNSLISRT